MDRRLSESGLEGFDVGRGLRRQSDLQLVEHGLHILFRLRVTRQHQPAAIDHGDPNLHHLNRGELFENRCGRQARSTDHEAILQSDLQTVSQKGDQHMSVGPMFELMMDRADSEFTLQRTKHALDLRQLHIAGPQHRRVFACEIAAQQLVPVALLRGVQFLFVHGKREGLFRNRFVLSG